MYAPSKLVLGFTAKILNLHANEIIKLVSVEREATRQLMTVETEICTFEVGYCVKRRQGKEPAIVEPSPQIQPWQEPTPRKQRQLAPEIRPAELEELRCENERLHEQLSSLQEEMSSYQKDLSEEFSAIEQRSNTLMVKTLKHQRNELQLKNEWEKERQELMGKIVRMREMLDKVVIL